MEEYTTMSNAEMKVMNKIWTKQEGVTVADMVEAMNADGEEWAYQTVATFLKRLEAKGILSATKTGNRLSYVPLISKEQYQRREARGFVKNKFSGSLKNFLAAFSGDEALEDEEIKELKDWLNEFDD